MDFSRLSVDEEQLAQFCERWGIAQLSVFGSVLRDDFRPDSDIDFLVTWVQASPRLFDFFALKRELAELVGRDVDVLQRHLVEQSHNPYRRQNILSSARAVYPPG